MKELKKEKKFEIGSGLVLSVVMMEIATWNDGWLLGIKKEKNIWLRMKTGNWDFQWHSH